MASPSIPFPLESHAERRRGQLTRIAAHVIETEGVDALRMPRVAELAGCARSLVYRYFPRREDLFAAVISEFYERLEERLDPAKQRDGMRALADGGAARPLLESIWDVVAEIGAGGLILYASPRVGVELGEALAEAASRFDAFWVAPLQQAGLTEVEASLVVRSALALQTELLERHRRGEVSRDQAIDLGQRALSGLLAGLREGGGKR
jgi:AcrR family transcriptional regulator